MRYCAVCLATLALYPLAEAGIESPYARVVDMVKSGAASFVEAVASVGSFSWESWMAVVQAGPEAVDAEELPIWQEKQCNVPGEEVMKRCSCFEMMNMGDQWLNRSKVPQEEYRQLRRRAAKMHHKDKSKGSDEAMLFLTKCTVLLCGDEKCMGGGVMGTKAKQQKKEYIESMRSAWRKCERRSRREGSSPDERAKCYRAEVEDINEETFKLSHGRIPRDDVRNPKPNAQQSGEELIIVFLDNSNSMTGDRLVKAKKVFKRLFPSFQKAPTSIHFFGGNSESISANVFKERVEQNGGSYENVSIRATLVWENCNDIDLHVIEPSGNEIFYRNKQSLTGGALDIDRNAGGCKDHSPVENIRWHSNESPLLGPYRVDVNYYGMHASIRTTPFKVEVTIGANSQHFEGALLNSGQRETVHTFDFQGLGPSRNSGDFESREVFPSTVDFTLDDVDRLWQAKSWSTYAWEYSYKVLREHGRAHTMTKLRAVFILDGYDNDSPGRLNGPSGGIEMMNRLHQEGIRPELDVYCIGNDACMGDEAGMNHFRDLVLHSGGVYGFLPDTATREEENRAVNAFAEKFTAPHELRAQIAQDSKREWLRMVTAGEPVSNRDEEYTRELRLFGEAEMASKTSPSGKVNVRDDEEPEETCKSYNGVRRCSVK